ncbi:MAG: putative copper-transporting ATPase PacS [Ignavibacteria bacterium]|nr:putative copper-transporting ATPase PacS [Ignavibacteria bacterium]
MSYNLKKKTEICCYHCGESCSEGVFSLGDKNFCCAGCKAVFEILYSKDLCNYYNIDEKAGIKLKDSVSVRKFDYLDDENIKKKLIEFTDKKLSSVSFKIPGIHCSSCIWLLEKLYKLNEGILSSKVNFLKKNISIVFDNTKVSLKDIVIILTSIGYEPLINLDESEQDTGIKSSFNKSLITKIGIAGFCMGNIMLFSFPEYFGLNIKSDNSLRQIFNYLNLILSLPVLFYCSSDYFKSAFNGLKNKFLNIDFPISLGLAAMFVRSLYEILIFGNAGFSDSLAGLVFLLLLGKLFQNKTYETLNFERDYRSYLPISVSVKKSGNLKSVPVINLKTGDRIVIRNNEIIPADSILFSGTGNIDYSFVTGESFPEQKVLGEIIYAGGRHFGGAIELEIVRTVSQSYLTQLWNDKAFEKKKQTDFNNITNQVSRYFTVVILLIAIASAVYWLPVDINLALNAFTTVLIIACPCALALTAPFALGNAVRIFGRNKFYLKNSGVVEELSAADAIVFDKTGTITNSRDVSIKFTGSALKLCEQAMVKSLVKNSTHPLSRLIYESIDISDTFNVKDFSETVSEGISGTVEGNIIKLGSLSFLLESLDYGYENLKNEITKSAFTTNVFLSIDNQIKGFFSFNNKYRDGLSKVVSELNENYELSLISGDNNSEKSNLKKIFTEDNNLLFNQTPQDKLNYIKALQANGSNVIMIGDGLNDAGALKQSNTGISVSEDITNFSPASDALIDASVFYKLNSFLKFSKHTIAIIKICFVISFIYNVIGLYLASQGTFSPLIAAVLMPINSISIILIVIGATNFSAKKLKLK